MYAQNFHQILQWLEMRLFGKEGAYVHESQNKFPNISKINSNLNIICILSTFFIPHGGPYKC
jgi:hypothetical protein